MKALRLMRRPAGLLWCATLLSGLPAAKAQAAGDPARGEIAFQKCYACHSVEPGEVNLPGPNLRGVVGRLIAAQPDFTYSPALRMLAAREPVWTEALLDRFMADPEKIAPGTGMGFPGLANAAERDDLLAYLRGMQPAPAP